MAYNKEVIEQLFLQYAASGAAADLDALVMACAPMVMVVLSRYDELSSQYDDITQEVLLRLWMAFSSRERVRQEVLHPHVWVYKKVRDYIITTTRQYSRQLGLPLRLSDREKEIIDLHDSEQKTFEDIAKTLKLHTETVRCYYSIAHCKLESASQATSNDKSFLEQADCSHLDPAKRYEMKDLHRAWRIKLHAMAETHPNISPSGSTRRIFMRYADDLLGKDMTDDE